MNLLRGKGQKDMLWDRKGDSERTQRLKNGFLLKMWVKNDTRDALLPILGVALLVLLIIAVCVRLLR